MEERPIADWWAITKKEVEKRGWDELDVILISGDAYVDHPAPTQVNRVPCAARY